MECEDKEAEIAACRAKITEAENKLFKPIIGCEMYVARRTMDKKEASPTRAVSPDCIGEVMKKVIIIL